MALIVCPDCGNSVSDKAKACPKCGYPIESMALSAQKSEEPESSQLIQDSSLEKKTFSVSQAAKKLRASKKNCIIASVSAIVLVAAIGMTLFLSTRGSHGIVGKWQTMITDSVIAEYEFTKDGNFISYAGECKDQMIAMGHGTYLIKDGQVLIDMPQATDEEYTDYSVVNGKLQLYGREWERVK